MTGLIEHLRRVATRGGAEVGDGELLGRFIDRRDEAALAALVRRHGSMVWGVCRRLLAHQDAEDAFQVTFLVLVRKAASVAPRAMVANWLYGVAHQTALHARRTTARRRAREVQVTAMPDPEAVPPEDWTERQLLLDEELSRLPDIYRAVVVSCDLEGRTRKEVARQLGVPEGTVAGRLARARVLLAKRLAHRGVVTSGGALAAVLSAASAGPAFAPPALVAAAIKAASLSATGLAAGVISVEVAALAEGVSKAMFLSKLKTVALVLVATMVVVAGGGFLHHTQAADPMSGGNSKAGSRLGSPNQGADPRSSKSKDADSDKVMTAGELLSVFDKNEAAGDDRFVGKAVRASGRVRKVERVSWSDMAPPPIAESDENYYVLTLFADRADGGEAKRASGGRGEKALPAVFVFPVGGRKELGGLEAGQPVTIEGVCLGRKEGAIVFTGCRIVKSK